MYNKIKFDEYQEDFGGRRFTSARMKSKAKWTYGRLQIRAKLPTGRGLWPALWMVSLSLIFSIISSIKYKNSYPNDKSIVMLTGQITVKLI